MMKRPQKQLYSIIFHAVANTGNSNSTFIALNLCKRADSKAQWIKHYSIFMSRDAARVMHHGRQWNRLSETMEGMPCCRGKF